jgi:hypothetical protein
MREGNGIRLNTALGLISGNSPSDDAKLVFVVRGTRTSINPIQAFKQGLESERSNQAYLLHGYRCPGCGSVELTATEQMSWPP